MSKTLKPWEENGMSYGRRDHIPDDPNQKLRMEQVRFVDGDYDQGGAYWGMGPNSLPLWCAWNEEATVWVRAKNRTEAKTEVRKSIKGARFFN